MNEWYSKTWGFRPEAKQGLTLWTESATRRGGVAMLLNPYSTVTELEPWLEDRWTPHWMASRFRQHDAVFLVVNCYEPTDRVEREALFESLKAVIAEHDGPVVLGGDFNCTLNPSLDRSSVTLLSRHDSPKLRSLLAATEMEDVLEDEMAKAEDERDHRAFHASAHTHYYTLPGGGHASSRLDRWYVSARQADWIRDIDQSVPGPAADHNGVTIRVQPQPPSQEHLRWHDRRVKMLKKRKLVTSQLRKSWQNGGMAGKQVCARSY
ncbi:reverse transcriptase [Globisporangium polare]